MMLSFSSAGTPPSLTTRPVTLPTTASMKISQLQTTEIKKWRTGVYPLMMYLFWESHQRYDRSWPLPSGVHFSIRIRALYAQILEKDAVIKILNQRLHQDQSRKDEQTPHANKAAASLRPATSTPSISTTMTATKTRGEEFADHLLNWVACGRRVTLPLSPFS